jgi:hypothetical protein
MHMELSWDISHSELNVFPGILKLLVLRTPPYLMHEEAENFYNATWAKVASQG